MNELKLTNKIPKTFRWKLYFYFLDDLWITLQIKKDTKKRYCDLVFDHMEKELQISTDKDLTEWGRILEMIRWWRILMENKEIEEVLKDFKCYDGLL